MKRNVFWWWMKRGKNKEKKNLGMKKFNLKWTKERKKESEEEKRNQVRKKGSKKEFSEEKI